MLSSNLLSLGSGQEFKCSSKSSSKDWYVPSTVKALKMQWSPSTIKGRDLTLMEKPSVPLASLWGSLTLIPIKNTTEQQVKGTYASKVLIHDNVVGLYGDTAKFSSKYPVADDFLYRKNKILLFVLCSPSAFPSLCVSKWHICVREFWHSGKCFLSNCRSSTGKSHCNFLF